MNDPDFRSTPDKTSDEPLRSNNPADVAEVVQDDLEDVGTELKSDAKAIAGEAREELSHASEEAKGIAERQKQLLADQLDTVSSSFDKVAKELAAQGEVSAQYIRMIADGTRNLTSAVRDNSVDGILGMAEDIGRKQPVAFAGGAALLGFVASRFIAASASRRSRPTGEQSSRSRDNAQSNAASSNDQSQGGRDAEL